jgi:hypothetical protein
MIVIILLSKFRVTKISVSCITDENHIGSSFIRQKYFCLPTKIAVLPTVALNKISGGVTPAPSPPVATGLIGMLLGTLSHVLCCTAQNKEFLLPKAALLILT